MTTCSLEKTSRLRHLAPLLDPEVYRVYVNLNEDVRIKYDKVKNALFQHYQVILVTYRLKLDNLKRKSGEIWVSMISRGKNLSKKWLAE